ncbi:hypothetical protein KTC96_22580 (plasmid) [Clostridium estertheticum]|nr:hypothetical protein [Clostridium estertheticum]MBX4260416.1 hypothetical protein [Clostridium estertheticum]WLC73002.1 hypothetical protein KTC96_22580 [Clostridium estertheticum]
MSAGTFDINNAIIASWAALVVAPTTGQIWLAGAIMKVSFMLQYKS